EHPDVPLPRAQGHLRLVDVQRVAGKEPLEQLLVRCSVVASEQRLEHVDLSACDPEAEEFHQHSLDGRETCVVCHMVVHRPTLQPVEVLVQTLIPLWQEGSTAPSTSVRYSPADDDPPPHSRGSKDEIEGSFAPGILDLPAAAPDLHDVFRLAVR